MFITPKKFNESHYATALYLVHYGSTIENVIIYNHIYLWSLAVMTCSVVVRVVMINYGAWGGAQVSKV